MIPIQDTVASRNPPLAVYVLIGLNVLVFSLELSLPQGERERLFYLLGIVPARYSHPQWAQWVGFRADDYWPFLTSMFLHGGWMHIIGNMWTLWIFGDNVEDRMGPVRFAVFYLLCGLIAGVVHWFTNPDSVLPTVGASGAVAGVLGAYLVLFPHAQLVVMFPIVFYPLFFEVPAVLYFVFWALSQLFSGILTLASPGEIGGVAWWAHVGGFSAGLVLHPLFLRPRRVIRRWQPDEYGVEGAWM
ncbi:MAG TPA: rhomboid family intramembrane serine protease [Isosphaeraceae bacterium]|nr:rhomboid family intramembrane serine protease [Isosphaeraceae bacterium]